MDSEIVSVAENSVELIQNMPHSFRYFIDLNTLIPFFVIVMSKLKQKIAS